MSLKMARQRRKGGELWGDFLKTAEQGPVESNPKGMSIYYCEMCDKDLKTEEAKETHFAEHIKCGHPGCKFEAHFLVRSALHNSKSLARMAWIGQLE